MNNGIQEYLATLQQAAPFLLNGALITVQLWVATLIISLTVGTLFGVLRCNKLRIPVVSLLLDGITLILRGVPYYLQLMIAYFVLPEMLNINLSPFMAATYSLGFCSAAYISQSVRSGINSIPLGQWEAATVLGFTVPQAVRFIILPQMLRNVLPTITSELDQTIKTTSLVSTIGVIELTGACRNIIAQQMNPLTMYGSIAIIYLIFSLVLNGIGAYIERRLRS